MKYFLLMIVGLFLVIDGFIQIGISIVNGADPGRMALGLIFFIIGGVGIASSVIGIWLDK